MNLIIQNGQEVRYSKDRIVINGVTISVPQKFKANSVTIVDNRLFVGGYEYINGKWKKTLRALWHKWF